MTSSPRPTAAATKKPAATRKPDGSPAPTPINLAPYLTSEVAFASLWDGSIDVALALVNSSGNATEVAHRAFVQFDSLWQQVVPSTYRITLQRAAPGAKPLVCTIKVATGQRYELVVLQDVVTITREDYTPKTAADLVVGTSPLCTK